MTLVPNNIMCNTYNISVQPLVLPVYFIDLSVYILVLILTEPLGKKFNGILLMNKIIDACTFL